MLRLLPKRILVLFIYFFCFGGLQAQFTLSDSLQLYYPFNGNANDQSGNGINGTVNGGASLTTDRYGNANSAYLFDGTNDWIDTDETFDYNYRTVCFWFYSVGVGSEQAVLAHDDIALTYGAFSTNILTNGNLVGRAGGTGSLTYGSVQDSVWYFATLVRDGSDVRYYVNGQLAATASSNGSGSSTGANDHLVIGVSRFENTKFFDGKIDDVRVYNRALSLWEIQYLYCPIAASISTGDTNITEGQWLTFYNDSNDTNTTNTWLINGDTILHHGSLTYNFWDSGSYEVILFATDSFNGCIGADTVTVSVTSPTFIDSAQCLHLQSFIKTSDSSAVLSSAIDALDFFGWSGTAIGDLDGDGIQDIAVTAPYDDDGGSGSSANRGAVYILFMDSNGSVADYQKISDTQGSFTAAIADQDNFGCSVAAAGDLNGDGVPDLFVGSNQDDDGGSNSNRGAVYILYLNADGTVQSYKKISATSGGNISILSGAKFGSTVFHMPDLNGDGVKELAVGATYSSEGGSERGAVYILFLDTADTATSYIKLSNTEGTFAGNTQNIMRFGSSISSAGDLNQDGIPDLIVGATGYSGGTSGDGAVYFLELNSDGSVQSYSTISNSTSGLANVPNGARFGANTTYFGNFNGELWLMVGARLANVNSTSDGSVYILRMDSALNVLGVKPINDNLDGFEGNLDANDQFGFGNWLWQDINGDGIPEFMVSARTDDDNGSTNAGAFYTFRLDLNCCPNLATITQSDTVVSLGTTVGFSTSAVADSLTWLIDQTYISSDTEIVVSNTTPGKFRVVLITTGASCYDTDTVTLHVLPEPNCLDVDSTFKISSTSGNFNAGLEDDDLIGMGMTGIGDVNGDGVPDMVFGAIGDDDGGSAAGALYVAFLNADGTVLQHHKISSDSGGFGVTLDAGDELGVHVADIGDLDGDGIHEIAASAPYDDDGGTNRGAVYIIFLDSTANVASVQKISDSDGGLSESLDNADRFGTSVCGLGDLNYDGIPDIMVGMPNADESFSGDGSVIVLFMDTDGTVLDEQKIANGVGGFPAINATDEGFGGACASLGDMDNDGYLEVAISAHRYGNLEGAIYILSLDSFGLVHDWSRISEFEGGFNHSIPNTTSWGADVANLGDVDGDGYLDLAVGAWRSSATGSEKGEAWLLSLDSFGYVFSTTRISDAIGNLNASLDNFDRFGRGVCTLGDVNGDGVTDFAVGARHDDDGGSDRGAVYVLTVRDTCCLLNVDFNLNQNDFCVGDGLTATNTTSFNSGGETCQWVLNDSLVGTAQNLSLTVSTPGTYQLKLIVSDSCTRLHSENFVVHADPIADAGSSAFICLGDSIQLSASGGSSYQWSGGASLSNDTVSNPLAFPTSTTIYFLTVTDAYGCTDDDNVAIIVNTPPTVDVSGDSLICLGNSTSLTATGALTYTWTPTVGLSAGIGSTVTASPSATTTYIVEGTDANGCTDTASTTIFIDTSLVASLVSTTNVSCYGGNDGAATASSSGGTSPFTYAWSSGSTTLSESSLAAGNYGFTVSDVEGCVDSLTVTITQPDSISASASIAHVGCNGSSTGSITLSASGGTTPYSYAWSNAASSASITGLAAGSYSITITDGNSCTNAFSYTITEPTALDASIASSTDVSCLGGTDGTATASATGGTTPYTYAWSSGSNAALASNLSAGTYIVTVTDANGCSDTAHVTIDQPSTSVSVVFTDSSDVSCNGGLDGAATAIASGGIGSYSYLWSSSQTSAAITGLAAGTYSVTATDANGCQASNSITIDEPTALSISVSVDSNVSCNGGNDASATASGSGGTPSYTYVWSEGSTMATQANLGSGTFSVTVTDANGCSSSTNVSISEPNNLIASTSVISNVSCFGGSDGSVSGSATGGTTPYTYAWSSGGTTTTESGLAAGSYTLSITDDKGCMTTSMVTVSEPTILVANIDSTTQPLCNGGSNGFAYSSGSGATPPYTFAWSSGGSSAVESGLAAGSYAVTITDANGCSTSASTSIGEPTVVNVTAILDSQVVCNGDSNGSALATGSGGVGGYSYLWDNGETTALATALNAGTHSVTATDANGCPASTTVLMTEPIAVVATLDSSDDVICNGFYDGAAYTSASGGTGSHYFNWNSGDVSDDIDSLTSGVYVLSVTDDNACLDTLSVTIIELDPIVPNVSNTNVTCFGGSDGTASSAVTGGGTTFSYAWSNGPTTTGISSLSAGVYALTITDENDCFGIDSAVVTHPDSMEFAFTTSAITCNAANDGVATAHVMGETSPYTYTWEGGGTDSTKTGLSPGFHGVTATDVNGCTNNDSVEIIEPTSVALTTTFLDSVSCAGGSDGSAVAIASGGVGNYSYLWSNGDNTDTLDNVAAGTYTVTAQDSNGCQIVDSVTILEPDSLHIVLDQFYNVACYEQESGAIYVTYTGGTGNVSYAWSTGSTNLGIFSQDTGWYSVTITDTNGCQDSASYYISQPDTAVHVSMANLVDPNCFGGENGGIALVPGGGTPGYTYNWVTSQTTDSIGGLGEGSYSVTITDANNCAHDTTFSITQPTAPDSAMLSVSNLLCNGDTTGSMTATFNGGTAPYFYSWSNGSNNPSISGIQPGTYSVTVYDVEGCTQVKTDSIFEPDELVLSLSIVDSLLCFGDSNGVIASSTTGGIAPYVYVWSNATVNDTLFDAPAGIYSLIVADSNLCLDTLEIELTEPDLFTMDSALASSVSCHGDTNGMIFTNHIGGVLPYVFAWSNGSISESISNLAPGSYSITSTDGNGCSFDSAFTIIEPDSLMAFASLIDSANCSNTADGVVAALGIGGTLPYGYTWNSGDSLDTVFTASTGNYSVTIVDANGCSDSASVFVPFAHALPISMLTSDTIFCNATSGFLTANPIYAQYAWSNGDTLSATEVAASGIYVLTVTTEQGCSTIDSATVGFGNSTPVFLGNDTVICVDDAITPFTIVPSPSAFSAYNWSTGDTTSTLTVSSSGLYTLIATNGQGCLSDDKIVVVFDTCINIGLDELSDLGMLSIYPNPTRNQFVVEWAVPPTEEITYRVHNTLGGLVMNLRSPSNRVWVDLAHQAAGVYILTIQQGARLKQVQIIKQ